MRSRVGIGGWPLALFTMAIPGDVDAQQDTTRTDTTVFRIEGIRIQAERPVTTVGGASAVEVTMDSLRVPTAATAEEVLRAIPMVHVRTNSRGQAEISVRGSESRQVAVLFDGVPLTLGWDARTDVSVLPADAANEVTFVRGLSSILHGPNVLGGVVEMNVVGSSRLPWRSARSFSAMVDGVGGYGTAASLTTPFETTGGRGVVRVGAGFRDSPGSPLADGVAEPVPSADDLRLNTDLQNLDGFIGFRYVSDGGAWGGLSVVSHKAERGIAAELGSSEPRLWRYPHVSRTIMAVTGGTGHRSTRLGVGDLEASVGIDVGRTEIRSYATRAYDEVDGTEDGDDRTLTLRLLGDHTLGGRAELRSSLTFADINHDETVDGERAEYEQRLLSLGAETVVRLTERGGALENVRLSFGGAYDRGTTPKTGGLESLGTVEDWGARVGLSALVADGSALIHAGVSRRGRFPALRETYSESLSRFVPNPDLTPEHLLAFETGVTTRVGNGDLQVVGFHHQLTDAIRRITLPDRRRMRVNSEELTSTGLEVLVSQTFGGLAVGGDLTLQAVRLRDPETSSTAEPENLPERAGSAYVRFPVGGGFAATAEAEYTGPQFCQDLDTAENVRLDGGTWLNAILSKAWRMGRGGAGRNLETRASVDNLTDTALYDQCGLPRPGRLFRLQIRIS